MHDAGAPGRAPRGAAVLEREAELVLGEELVEHLAAERADGIELVALRIMLEQDGGERLRRRAGDHARALGGIGLAVLPGAMGYRSALVGGGLFGPENGG